MDPTATIAAPYHALLAFAVQAMILYLCGSYATSRALALASGASMRSRAPIRVFFYVFVMPGVVLHESAHYLACLLTGTRVARFAPFAPREDSSGRMLLGYVQHEKRTSPIMAFIGLAPMILNPLGILAATALLTPLSPAEILSAPAAAPRALLQTGFVTGRPLLAFFTFYLLLSFAVGSVPSREDLRAVPAALVLFSLATASFVLLGHGDGLLSGADRAAQLAGSFYTLPVLVAISAALLVGLAELLTDRST